MASVKLIRDKETGNYYTEDMRFFVKKCSDGWNIYDSDSSYGNYLDLPTGWASTLSCVRSWIDEISISDINFF